MTKNKSVEDFEKTAIKITPSMKSLFSEQDIELIYNTLCSSLICLPEKDKDSVKKLMDKIKTLMIK